MNAKLKKLYCDPAQPSSFYGVNKLAQALEKSNEKKHISRSKIVEWLETQDAHTIHKARRLRYPRRNYNVSNIDDVWETDLVDLRSIKSYNDGYCYILVVIDVLSKFVWAEALIDKTCTNVTSAFHRILTRSNNRVPIILQSDKGKEFIGSSFQKLLKENDIQFRLVRSPDVKAAVVERFNRTLKERMWRYFTNFNTKRYIDILQTMVGSYNNSRHSGTKMAPSEVTLQNAYVARSNLNHRYGHHFTKKEPKYSVGDLVRVSTSKNVFAKAYEGNYTEEIFEVIRVSKTRAPYTYILQDLSGDEIDGIFYEQELSRVRKDLTQDTFIVDKIIRTEGKGRNKKYLVSWAGYPEKFNSWIPASQLKNIR